LFVRWVALVCFFSCLLKKQSSACALAYKNHDKKVEGNTAKQTAFGAACRAFAAWVLGLSGKRVLFSNGGLHFGYIQFVSNCIQNKTATDGGSF
jgi:hypothetical protein